ncbi:MAG: hypothetical protein NVSMB27_15880 [Ktedonobacteraceae bacterium]
MSLVGAPPAGILAQEGWRPTLFREMVAGGAQVSEEALRTRQASVKPLDPAMIQWHRQYWHGLFRAVGVTPG